MHTFTETAALLRDLARAEIRIGGKWADQAYVKRLRTEAAELERLARIDRDAT